MPQPPQRNLIFCPFFKDVCSAREFPPGTTAPPRSMDRSAGSDWPHKDTLIVIDCVEKMKRPGHWTEKERYEVVEVVQKELEAHNRPPRTAKVVHRRLQTLGEKWHSQRSSFALYNHGWDRLLVTRAYLENNPESRRLQHRQVSQTADSTESAPLLRKSPRNPYRSTSGEQFRLLYNLHSCSTRVFGLK